jgi:hypothetical protein
MAKPRKKKLLTDRFWAKVDVRGPDECWPWKKGLINKDKYGKITDNYKTKLCHRVAWELTNGPISDGIKVLHKCDFKPCCNPNHLFQGTSKDNTQDMIIKGRQRGQFKEGHPRVKNHRVGESCSYAVMTELIVISAREKHKREGLKYPTIAKMFNICPTTMQSALNYKSWKHLP